MSSATYWITQLAVAVSAAAGVLIFAVRLVAIRWDIGLPTFQSR